MDKQNNTNFLVLKDTSESPHPRNSSFHHSQRTHIERKDLSKIVGSTSQSQNNGEKVPILPMPYIDMTSKAQRDAMGKVKFGNNIKIEQESYPLTPCMKHEAGSPNIKKHKINTSDDNRGLFDGIKDT